MSEADFDLVTTRNGDRGESSLNAGPRLPKDDLHFECLGDLDELGSVLGVCRARLSGSPPGRPALPLGPAEIQRTLQKLCAAVAAVPQPGLGDKEIELIEKAEKTLLAGVALKKGFALPGASRLGADFDLARAVARRAERRLVSLIRDKSRPDLHSCQRWLNRLSDYLFVCARRFDQEV